MPWMETSPVEQRERFIRDHRLDLYAMAELCARYGIRRKTGYKWLGRFEEGSRLGLHDRSRAPHHCPHRITREVAAVIWAARRQHPRWGPAKLLAWLQPRHPDLEWPAVSTAGDLLARRGLVKKRRRRRQWQHPGVVPAVTTQPNDLWTADFKGHFRTRDATIATRSRSLISTHGISWRATVCFPPRATESIPFSIVSFGNTGCRALFALTMACPSPPPVFTGSPEVLLGRVDERDYVIRP